MRTSLQIKAITFVIWFSLFPVFIYAETEPNNVFSEANLLESGIIMNGELGKTENSITDTEDWYKIEVTDNSVGEFSFQTDNTLVISSLRLYSKETDGSVGQRNMSYYWTYEGKLTVADLAAGTYYIMIDRYNQIGSYTLTYNLIPKSLPNDPEPNNDYSKAILLDDNKPVTGHLGYYYLPEGAVSDRDVQDWYKITINDNAIAEFSFATDSILKISSLRLYSITNDTTISERNMKYYWDYGGKLTIPDLAAGTYYLKIDRDNQFGTYTLTYNLTPKSLPNDLEPNNDYLKALQLTDNKPVTGHLGYFYLPGAPDRDVEDWYKITINDNAIAEFSFATDSILKISSLRLYSITNDTTISERNMKYYWDYAGKLTVTDLAAGTYYLKIDRDQNYGNYTLTYNLKLNPLPNDLEPNNDYSKALQLNDNKPVTGHLGYYYLSGATDRDVEDWYKITITDNAIAEFSFATDSVLKISSLRLYSIVNDTTISERNMNYFWNYGGKLTLEDLAAGTYYLKINRHDQCGTYTLIYNLKPNPLTNDVEPNNKFQNAILLSDKKSVTGHLGYFYLPGAPDRDVEDWYKIVIPDNAIAEFSFQTDSTLQISALRLYSEVNDTTISERNMKYFWNYGENYTVPDLAAGTYYLKIDRYKNYGNYTLTYNLTLNPLPNDTEPNNSFQHAIILSDKDSVTGHLGYFYLPSAPDRDVEDWYKIVIPDNAKAEFSFVTDSILVISALRLYSVVNDTTISERNMSYFWNYGANYTVSDLAAGTYYLKIDRWDKYGNYTLAYNLTPNPLANDTEPNNSFQQAVLLSDKDSITGHLGYYYFPSAPDRDVEDWYKIIITENAKAEFSFVTDSFLVISSLRLYSVVNDSTVSERNMNYFWNFGGKMTIYDLAPGTYYLKIDRHNQFGSYTLNYNKKYYKVGFETARYNNEVKIINKSNGDSFEWDFGDGATSTAKFPEHTYTSAGDFLITQKVKIENSSVYWIAKDTVSIQGIERFTPEKTGKGGDMVLTVYGGGLDETTEVKLINGTTVLTPEKVIKGGLGMIDAIFNLHFTDPGVYDVSIGLAGQTAKVFTGGLTVEGLQYPHVVSSIEGYGTLRTGRTWPYNLVLTNTGNVLARGVNAYIIVPDNVEFYSDLKPFSKTVDITQSFSYHDDELDKDFSVSNEKVKAMMDLLRTDYIKLDSLFGEPFKGKAYPVFVPLIAANSTIKVPFRVKSTSSSISDEGLMQSFVLPVNMFGSCASPMTTEMMNKTVDVMLANLDKLPIVDKNPYLKTFVKVANIGKSAIRNAASYFGYLAGGMSEEEAFHEAYISEGQLDKANAEVITGLVEWGAELGLDKLKNVSQEQLNQFKTDRLYYLKKALEENKAGDKFGVQLFKGFAKDNNERFERLKGLRDLLENAEKLKSANGMMNDASEWLEEYAKECPELNDLLNTFKDYSDDYSGIDNLTKKHLTVGTSVDPNEIAGPHGYQSQRFIASSQAMDYIIRFENKAEAPLAAQIVNVYDTLDVSKYDLKTFELSNITIGDSVIEIPRGRDSYFTEYDMRPNINLLVGISAKLDTVSGIVNWQFVSLDPDTKDLTNNPVLGFLPPNTNAPDGEGSVSFTIKLKQGLSDETTISNKANIIFDFNDPIVTNVWKNTIDEKAPSGNVSSVTQLTDSTFVVDWTGNDQGSKIRYYELYGSVNDSPFAKVGKYIGNSVTFKGEIGSNYSFCVIPVDSVGNAENKQIISEGYVTLKANQLIDIENNTLIISPIPAKDQMHIQLKNVSSESYTVELIGMSGIKHKMGNYTGSELQTGIDLNITTCSSGLYLIRIIGDQTIESKKITIK